MIGFISLVKDNGKRAYMRVDEIAAFSQNETKLERGGELVPCITITMRNNVSWHFPHVTATELIKLMSSATAGQVHLTDESALGA